jgi:hypothetical protein
MSNVLSIYDPIWYAQEAILALEKALGLANKVYRGYDRTPQDIGSTIQIRVPSVFTTEDAPSTAQDIKASYIPIVLDQWKEVKFKLTDKELTHTGERIITEHIRPAAYAIADTIDQALAANYNLIPWEVAASSPWAVVDVTGARQRLFDNKVNMKDPNNLWAMVDGTGENELLALSAFAQWQGAGAKGVDAQTEGELGRRYGFGFFANQNTPDHAAGSITSATPVVKTTVALGLKDIIADDGTMTGDVNIGDIFSIAGHTQQYVITADATAGSNEIDLAFEPALEAEATAEDAIVFSQNTGSQSLFFNRNWCALAMAPLSEMGGELGAKVATITDPVTGLSLRSRIYYVGNSSEVHVALDVLYGHKVLDGNRACRVWNA